MGWDRDLRWNQCDDFSDRSKLNHEHLTYQSFERHYRYTIMNWCNLTWWWCMAYLGCAEAMEGREFLDRSRSNF